MRARALGALATLALLSLTVALAVARNAPQSQQPAPSQPAAVVAKAVPAPVKAPAAEALRNVFRFADEHDDDTGGSPGEIQAPAAVVVEPPPAGPRLVGLIVKSGKAVAALALDGEVTLVGPGEQAAGVTVVSVADDAVRIRRADGSEATLTLP